MNLKKGISLLTLTAMSVAAVGCGQPELNPNLVAPVTGDEVSSLASGSQNGAVIPGEYIVKFKKNAKNVNLNSMGVKKVKDLGQNSGMQLVKLTNPRVNASSLSRNSSVEWIEPNRVIKLPKIIRDLLDKLKGKTESFPNDPMFKEQYAHEVSHSVEGWNLAKTASRKPVTVAIIDTGIDGTHPDLKAKLVDGYDAYGNGAEYKDKQGHGTHCAGIAAAITNNGIGVAGYAPDAKLMSVKVLQDSGSGTYAAVADGIAWAAKSDADVLSMSLGGPSSSKAIEEAVELALANDKVVVAAMGNSGNASLSYPAAIKGVMAVGATDNKDERARFSQYGQHISVSAPGVAIMSTFPTYSSGMPSKNYGSISGTSMATPGVAGLAALVRSVNPGLKHKQVQDIIEKTADDLGDKGFDIYYGHGRINTFEAVKKAMNK